MNDIVIQLKRAKENIGKVDLPPKPVDWIGFKFSDSEGFPVSNIKFELMPPGSDKPKSIATDVNGTVEVLKLKSGVCSITSNVKDQSMENVLNIGGNAIKGTENQDVESPGSGPFYLANVDTYKAKSGDTLQSIASANDISLDELSKFNWDTTNSDEIRHHLIEDVGAVVEANSNDDVIFADDTIPGIIFLPKPWEMNNLSTMKTHELSVNSIPLPVNVKNFTSSQLKIKNGDIVTLSVDTVSINDNKPVEIQIVEITNDEETIYKTLNSQVRNKKIEAQWDFNYTGDTSKIKTQEELKETNQEYQPPSFYWLVIIDGKIFGNKHRSGLLEFKDSINISILEHNELTNATNLEYTITFADGSKSQGEVDKEGKITLDGVPPGPYSVVVTEPTEEEEI